MDAKKTVGRVRQIIKKRMAEGDTRGAGESGAGMSGGAQEDAMKKVVLHVAKAHGGSWGDFTNWVSNAASKVGNELFNPDSITRKQVIPVAQEVGKTALELAPLVGVGKRRIGKTYEGGAEKALLNRTLQALQGSGESGAGYSGAGGKHRADAKTRKPGPHAMAVKALMAAHPGISLAQASKEVKAKGLAKKYKA